MTVKIEQSGGRGRFSVDNTEAFNADTGGNIEVAGSLTVGGDGKFNLVSIGRGAGNLSSNTIVGLNALISNTTGGFNTAMGRDAAQQATTATSLTAIGHSALKNATTASSSVAIGNNCALSMLDGLNNVAVGPFALTTSTSGSSNSAFGRASLQLSTGDNNTAVGNSAGATITTGSGNTILGRFNGNQTDLDIREKNNTIVLSNGNGLPVLQAFALSPFDRALYVGGFANLHIGTKASSVTTDPTRNLTDADNLRTQFILNRDQGTFRFIARNGQQSGTIPVAFNGGTLNLTNNAIAHELDNGTALFISKKSSSNNNANLVLDKHINSTGDFIQCSAGDYADSANFSQKFRVTSDGNIINSTFAAGSGSDIKLKENVVDASPKLDKLMDVRFVNFNLKGSELKQFGVIAQELEEVFPALVGETKDTESVEVTKTKTEREYLSDEEGNPVYDDEGNHKFEEKEVEYTESEERETGEVTKYVKYSILSLMAVKALQEANDKIIALEERLSALEAK